MHKFDYRLPRFPVQTPVRYTFDTSPSVTAMCTEVSVDGITVELQKPLAVGACGSAVFDFQGASLRLDVRVIHAGETHGGMVFLYKSDEERESVMQLIDSIASRGRVSRPVLAL